MVGRQGTELPILNRARGPSRAQKGFLLVEFMGLLWMDCESVLVTPKGAGGQLVMNLPTMQETRSDSWVGKIPWRRKWQPTPVFLPGESQRWKSLVGYSLGGSQIVGYD